MQNLSSCSKFWRSRLCALTSRPSRPDRPTRRSVWFRFATRRSRFRHSKNSAPSPEALGDVDALLAKLDQLIAKKRDLKQAAMQQLLSGQTRLAGFDKPGIERAIGEVAEIVSGATPRTSVAEYWGGAIPWCTPTDITATAAKLFTETERSFTPAGLAAVRRACCLRVPCCCAPVRRLAKSRLLRCLSVRTRGSSHWSAAPVNTQRVPVLPVADDEVADVGQGVGVYIP